MENCFLATHHPSHHDALVAVGSLWPHIETTPTHAADKIPKFNSRRGVSLNRSGNTCKPTNLRERVQVDLGDFHLRQNLAIDGHGCLKYLVHALPLMLQFSSRLLRQPIDWYFRSWQPPFLFLSLKVELWTAPPPAISLRQNNTPIHIPELCFLVAIK